MKVEAQLLSDKLNYQAYEFNIKKYNIYTAQILLTSDDSQNEDGI